MENKAFNSYHFKGSPKEIGEQHGETLALKIKQSVDFYRSIFKRSEVYVFEKAQYFKKIISSYKKEYSIEIDSIAKAANIDPLWIYALNSRSEILSLESFECTSIYFSKNNILGQNWDWGQEFENLAAFINIENEKGDQIQMITEPGIIGKIGLNSRGIGICMNILPTNKVLNGIPIHIAMRSILECHDFQEVQNVINHLGTGKASNLMIGSSNGEYLDIEFSADKNYYPPLQSFGLLHTNHYLCEDSPISESSKNRFDTAFSLSQSLKEYSIEDMKKILNDQSHVKHPICTPYMEHPDINSVGTVMSIIMDLKRKEIHLRKGNSPKDSFSLYSLL